MGLFSFIKDAGAKLFGGKTSAEKAAEEAEEKATEHLEAIAAKKEKDEATIQRGRRGSDADRAYPQGCRRWAGRPHAQYQAPRPTCASD